MARQGWLAQREAVVETAREMERLGLVAGSSGNVSLRVQGEPLLVAMTPHGVPYRSLKPEQVLVVDQEAEPVVGELPPSSEAMLHLEVYRSRPDAGSVIHTHSVFASVCAVAGLEIPPVVDELVVMVGGGVRVAEYGFPGSQELALRARDALEGRSAALLRLHGLVAVGKDLEEALAVSHLVERAAQVYLWTRLLGVEAALSPEVVAAEAAIYRMRHGDPPG